VEIKVTFNFIYIMHYNELMFFWHLFNNQHGTWVKLSTFNMLKPLFMNCILYLLQFIKTHVKIKNFTFILKRINDFFHIFSIINMCTWVKPFTFNMLKPLRTSNILHLLRYIETRAIQCFAIIFEWCSEIFHIFELSTFLRELNPSFWTY
jgi:hypothetical protein